MLNKIVGWIVIVIIWVVASAPIIGSVIGWIVLNPVTFWERIVFVGLALFLGGSLQIGLYILAGIVSVMISEA